MTDEHVLLPVEMLLALKKWKLLRIFHFGFIMSAKDGSRRYIAVAPTTRGRVDEFRGFAICYRCKDVGIVTEAFIEVTKSEIEFACDRLLELDYIKSDPDEQQAMEPLVRWLSRLDCITVMFPVQVVQSDGFVPMPAFSAEPSVESTTITDVAEASAAATNTTTTTTLTTKPTTTMSTTTTAKSASLSTYSRKTKAASNSNNNDDDNNNNNNNKTDDKDNDNNKNDNNVAENSNQSSKASASSKTKSTKNDTPTKVSAATRTTTTTTTTTTKTTRSPSTEPHDATKPSKKRTSEAMLTPADYKRVSTTPSKFKNFIVDHGATT